jgi:hypothetical protein
MEASHSRLAEVEPTEEMTMRRVLIATAIAAIALVGLSANSCSGEKKEEAAPPAAAPAAPAETPPPPAETPPAAPPAQ